MVLKPVTPAYLNDDYQDARVLDEGPGHVELEVIHYPFNSVASTLEGRPDWSEHAREQWRWIEPGATSDWTRQMRADLLLALERDGIEIATLDDREVVEHVSRWLMERAPSRDGFTSFITSFDDEGRPYVRPELAEMMDRRKNPSLSREEQWERELSARGMFEQRTRGSCTSSAIYLSGCLKAMGIPTRTVLCIPLIDASDDREHALAARLKHNEVRRIVIDSARRGRNRWTSHTLNEVHVGGRWRRLNYSELGQNILDPHCLGLMTHVATFADWADARMPLTIGRRQSLHEHDDLFGGTNPYSTISLSDSFGVHCKTPNPAPEERGYRVEDLVWMDSPELPADILKSCKKRNRFGLFALIDQVPDMDSLRTFMVEADLGMDLVAEGHPTLRVRFDPGYWWLKNGRTFVFVSFDEASRKGLRTGVAYAARPSNKNELFAWKTEATIRRSF